MDRARWGRSAVVAAVLGTLGILTSVSTTSAAIWGCPWTKNSTDKIDRRYNSGLHTGLAYYALDLNWYGSDGQGGPSADCGRSVLSVEYGEVNRTLCSDSTSQSGYGCYVEVKHPGKIRSFYAHMKENPVVRKGQKVRQGQTVGYVAGTNGTARTDDNYSCHLHLHMTQNDGKAALKPEAMWAKRNGLQCASQTGLAAGQQLVSCAVYYCGPY